MCSPVRISPYLVYLTLASALLEAVKTEFFFNVDLCTSPVFIDVTHARTEGAFLREAESCGVQTAGIASIFAVLLYAAAAVMIYRFPQLSGAGGGGGHPRVPLGCTNKAAMNDSSKKTALTDGTAGVSDYSLGSMGPSMMGMSKLDLGDDDIQRQQSEMSFANERGGGGGGGEMAQGAASSRASLAHAHPATRDPSIR